LAAAEKVTGSILGIGSDYYADEFKIYKIKVSYDDTPPPPQPGGVIPLPAAGWLMLGAIGGLGILGRRKRRS
jgi:hypothetical protein